MLESVKAIDFSSN